MWATRLREARYFCQIAPFNLISYLSQLEASQLNREFDVILRCERMYCFVWQVSSALQSNGIISLNRVENLAHDKKNKKKLIKKKNKKEKIAQTKTVLRFVLISLHWSSTTIPAIVTNDCVYIVFIHANSELTRCRLEPTKTSIKNIVILTEK